jgi:hypothetical protein
MELWIVRESAQEFAHLVNYWKSSITQNQTIEKSYQNVGQSRDQELLGLWLGERDGQEIQHQGHVLDDNTCRECALITKDAQSRDQTLAIDNRGCDPVLGIRKYIKREALSVLMGLGIEPRRQKFRVVEAPVVQRILAHVVIPKRVIGRVMAFVGEPVIFFVYISDKYRPFQIDVWLALEIAFNRLSEHGDVQQEIDDFVASLYAVLSFVELLRIRGDPCEKEILSVLILPFPFKRNWFKQGLHQQCNHWLVTFCPGQIIREI